MPRKSTSASSRHETGKKRKEVIPITIGVLGIGGLFYLLKKSSLHLRLKNHYLVIAGMISSMAAILFMLFRVIRFIIRLYP